MILNLETTHHEIKLERLEENYTITPYYYKDPFGIDRESMGDINLNRLELASLIIKLTELLHGKC